MKCSRKFASCLAVGLLLTSLSQAADKKQLEAALAAVNENLKTPAGKQYDEQAGKELMEKYLSTLKPCKQSLPAGTSIDPFDMFLKLKSDGQVNEVLVYPESQYAVCARTKLLAAKFSTPPHEDYWINVHMTFKH